MLAPGASADGNPLMLEPMRLKHRGDPSSREALLRVTYDSTVETGITKERTQHTQPSYMPPAFREGEGGASRSCR